MYLIVKRLIYQKGMTMEQFAKKLGIARVNLTKTIKGRPRTDTVERIAKNLDVHVTELFEPPDYNYFTCPHCKVRTKLYFKE